MNWTAPDSVMNILVKSIDGEENVYKNCTNVSQIDNLLTFSYEDKYKYLINIDNAITIVFRIVNEGESK